MVTDLFRRRTCTDNASRITHPKISPWVAKFNGEIVGVDIAYPFAGVRPQAPVRKIIAPEMASCLSRYCVCSVLPDLLAGTVTSTVMDDWVRQIGNPKRIVLDFGTRGPYGHAWKNLPHVYGIPLIAAPRREPRRNGLLERSFRSPRSASRAIMTGPNEEPGRKLITQATIARNHVPCATTGIPPALAMSGRDDLLSGCAAAMWNHDPADADALVVKKQNAMGNAHNARNAVINSSDKQSLRAVLSRNLPDRAARHIPIGAGVQIADRGEWLVNIFRSRILQVA